MLNSRHVNFEWNKKTFPDREKNSHKSPNLIQKRTLSLHPGYIPGWFSTSDGLFTRFHYYKLQPIDDIHCPYKFDFGNSINPICLLTAAILIPVDGFQPTTNINKFHSVHSVNITVCTYRRKNYVFLHVFSKQIQNSAQRPGLKNKSKHLKNKVFGASFFLNEWNFILVSVRYISLVVLALPSS